MSSSNLKRSGKAPKPSDGHREAVPSEVANSGLMETDARRSEPTGKDAVRSPETSFALPIEEMDLTNHAVRSPERAKNVFFENDYLNGE